MIIVNLECLGFWYLRKSSPIILNICLRVGDQESDWLGKRIDQFIFLRGVSISYVLSEDSAEAVNNPYNRIPASLSILIGKQKDYSNFLGENKYEQFIYQVLHLICVSCLSEESVSEICDCSLRVFCSIEL